MKKMIISVALLALIGMPGAVAQSESKGTTVGATINGTIPDAPVGHQFEPVSPYPRYLRQGQ